MRWCLCARAAIVLHTHIYIYIHIYTIYDRKMLTTGREASRALLCEGVSTQPECELRCTPALRTPTSTTSDVLRMQIIIVLCVFAYVQGWCAAKVTARGFLRGCVPTPPPANDAVALRSHIYGCLNSKSPKDYAHFHSMCRSLEDLCWVNRLPPVW